MIGGFTKRSFRGSSSGTYNVHALELATGRDRKLKGLNLTVRFLDDSEHVFIIPKGKKGAELLAQVYQHLDLIEKDYFGLQFFTDAYCKERPCTEWLIPSKPMKKQLGNCQQLYFRVKFYVSDPSKLQEEYTRYQFYLQLKRDIIEGRLYLPQSTATLLASYIAQSEFGDYNPENHDLDYIRALNLGLPQNEEMDIKIGELHKLHKDKTPAEAEFLFLDHAKRMDLYGIELHPSKDSAQKNIQLGVSYLGVMVFQNNIKINTFSWSKINRVTFKKKQFFIQLQREPSEDYDTVVGFNMEDYRSAKNIWRTCVEQHTFFRLDAPKTPKRIFSFGSKFSYSGRTEYQIIQDAKRRGIMERKFVRAPSKNMAKDKPVSPVPESIVPSRPSRPYDTHKVTSTVKEPKQAWTEDSKISDDDGGFIERTLEGPFSPTIAGKVMSYADDELPSPASNDVYETPPYSVSHSPTSHSIDDNIVTIVLYPDEDGKYGFNVKGGTEVTVPILVSRVAPNTPAYKCSPKLSEGDQILQINGHDVTDVLQSTVVALVQEARSTETGKLVLTVKPNVLYEGMEEYEEPPFQYVPVNDAEPALGNLFEQSMYFLADGLASGALIARYEMLYRKHPDLTCNDALNLNNINKNRYRDILPYDDTRVILNKGPNGDYINANFVDMVIPNSNIKNQYIATQGPLQSTTEDFWQMVLEQRCNLIIMLTTVIEKGRAKCYKYWPGVREVLTMQNAIVKCTKEETDESGSFVFREFSIVDVKNNQQSFNITHMQYIAWPDHGVPDSPQQFLKFTKIVQEHRVSDIPVIVHCSAGIGRTGVLVLMETALNLIAVGEPVYPLEIVKAMREQRAMMVQNASQYRFVCESVYAAYIESKEAAKTCEDKEKEN